MPDDRRKMLETLAAKRKAESQGPTRHAKPIRSGTQFFGLALHLASPRSSLATNMPDDRRKMLETLAAKRKAESQGPTRHAKPKVPSLPSKPVVKSGGEKPKIKPSSFSLKETPKKKKRVEKYESEGSDEEEDDSLSSESDAASGDDSDVEIIKKPAKNVPPSSKGKVTAKHEAKGSKLVRPGVDAKGKSGSAEKVKGRKKADDSSDEGVSDEDDGGDLSNDSGDQVDPGNILPGRTRRRATQPLQYDFGNASDEDDDSDA